MPSGLVGPRFVPGLSSVASPSFPSIDEGWYRLFFLGATVVNDANALVSGGINVPGGAANGVTETSATSQVTIVTVGADMSRPFGVNASASWIFPIVDRTGAAVNTTRPLMIEVLTEIVSISGGGARGLCCVSGVTNSTAFAGANTEGGVHDDATGRRLRTGSSSGIVDQVAAGATLAFVHTQYVFSNGIMSHSVSHGLDSTGALVAANRKVGNTSNVALTGTLSAFVGIGRSVGDGVSYTIGVRCYMRFPIFQIASFVP